MGVAGGTGTAVWLSGKLTQEFHASYQATIRVEVRVGGVEPNKEAASMLLKKIQNFLFGIYSA